MKNRIIHVNLFDGGTIISRKIIIILLLFALAINMGHVSAMEDNACIDFEDSQMSEGSSLEAISPDNSAGSVLLSDSNIDSDLMSDSNGFSVSNSDSSEELLSESESNDSSDDNPIVKNDTQIIIKTTDIVNGTYFKAYLQDSDGNPISDENVSFISDVGNYTSKTTSTGRARLKINLNPGEYSFVLLFNGSEVYNPCQKEVTITVFKNKVKLSLESSKVYQGNYISVYLKNAFGKAFKNQTILFIINGKTYNKTTDSEGRARLKIKLNPETYNLTICYPGYSPYPPKNKSYNLKVLKNVAKISVSSRIVINKNYFYAYLKDASGKALASQKVTFKINGKKYVRKTDYKGKAALKIRLKAKNYKLRMYFYGKSYYHACHKYITLTVKKNYAGKNAIWVWSTDKDKLDLNQLKRNGITNIFVHEQAVKSSNFKSWLKKVNRKGLKVHIWMLVFYKNGEFINPINKYGNIKKSLFKSNVKRARKYARIKGVSGVHFDYIRFPGTAYKYKKGVYAVNLMTKQLSKAVKKANRNAMVLAAVMPESIYSDKYYYGQDIKAMSKYIDVFCPMIYSHSYGLSSKWIRSQTKAFKKAMGGNAQIWTGLQTYGATGKRLSNKALTADIKYALKGGAVGITFFRFGLFNQVNMNKITV